MNTQELTKEDKILILNTLIATQNSCATRLSLCGDGEEYKQLQQKCSEIHELHKKLHRLWVTNQYGGEK